MTASLTICSQTASVLMQHPELQGHSFSWLTQKRGHRGRLLQRKIAASIQNSCEQESTFSTEFSSSWKGSNPSSCTGAAGIAGRQGAVCLCSRPAPRHSASSQGRSWTSRTWKPRSFTDIDAAGRMNPSASSLIANTKHTFTGERCRGCEGQLSTACASWTASLCFKLSFLHVGS